MHDQKTQHESKKMTDGSSFYCPYCRTESILHEKHEYDGFTVVRTYYCCAFCGREIEPEASVSQQESKAASSTVLSGSGLDAFDSLFSDASSPESGSESRHSALDDLFGGNSEAESPCSTLDGILPASADSASGSAADGQEPEVYHFCRNCRHHFENPFRVHCVLHDKDVDPMADCPDFSPLPPHSTL